MVPRMGCTQRSSASTPTMRRSRRSTIGWRSAGTARRVRGRSPDRCEDRVGATASLWSSRSVGRLSTLPQTLGGVHREVGVAQQHADGLVDALLQRDADACSHLQRLVADDHRLGDELEHPVSRMLGREPRPASGRRVANSSAPPSRAMTSPSPKRAPYPHGHLGQQVVARGVSQAVVDRLEIIQIDEQHRRAATARANHLGEGVRDRSSKPRAVGKPGQHVVQRAALVDHREVVEELGDRHERERFVGALDQDVVIAPGVRARQSALAGLLLRFIVAGRLNVRDAIGDGQDRPVRVQRQAVTHRPRHLHHQAPTGQQAYRAIADDDHTGEIVSPMKDPLDGRGEQLRRRHGVAAGHATSPQAQAHGVNGAGIDRELRHALDIVRPPPSLSRRHTGFTRVRLTGCSHREALATRIS